MEPETFKGLSQDIFYLFSSFFHQTTPCSPLIEKQRLFGDGGKFADNISLLFCQPLTLLSQSWRCQGVKTKLIFKTLALTPLSQ
jgi:hypothetical protein